MKTFLTTTAILLCLFTGVNKTSAQDKEKVRWEITHVQTTAGLQTEDIDECSKSLLDLEADLSENRLEIKDFSTFNLEADRRENDGFAQRKIYYFRDSVGQTGKLAIHADPTCENSEMRYLIFIMYDGKEKGRVFICKKPRIIRAEVEGAEKEVKGTEKEVKEAEKEVKEAEKEVEPEGKAEPVSKTDCKREKKR